MKKEIIRTFLLALVIIILITLLTRCGSNDKSSTEVNYVIKRNVSIPAQNKLFGVINSVSIITIDSCEWMLIPDGNATWGSHYGRCKYCAERRKEEIREVVLSILNHKLCH